MDHKIVRTTFCDGYCHSEEKTNEFVLFFSRLFVHWLRRRYSLSKKLKILLAFCSLNRIFAGVKQERMRHIASWLLLAVFVPILVLSSVHVHEESETITTECNDCVHHSCHGHMTAAATWAHDCVLCQFLTLKMLTAAVTAIAVYVHICINHLAQQLYTFSTVCCGTIVTRGPPSL